jgi:hypothetical protein
VTKFDWISTLAADSRLSDGHRLIGILIALKNVKFDDPAMEFKVRQTTVAKSCGTSERNVRRAYAELRDHGYIELVRSRERGLGGKSDKYRLTYPVQDSTVLYPDEVQDSTDRSTGQNGSKYRTELTEVQDRTNSTSSENVPLRVLEKDLEKGLERGAAGAASPTQLIPADENNIIEAELVDNEPVDNEPPDYCKAHMPYGTADPCTFCAVARHHKDAWKRRNPNALLNSLLRELNDNPGPNLFGTTRRHSDCTLCDEHGWLLGSDGTPVEPATRCPVCNANQHREGIA